MFKHIVIIIIIALFLLQACASTSEQSQQKNTETYSEKQLSKFVGVLKELIYTNPSVPVKLRLPKDWFLTLSDKRVLVIDDSPEPVMLEPFVRNSYRLLYLLKYKEIPAGKYNTSLILIASDAIKYVQSTTAAAHNQRIRVGLGKSGRDYRFDREAYDQKLAGQKFNILPSVANLNTGVRVFQEYYFAIVNDQLVTFILTFTNDKDREDLENIIKTLSFK